MTDLRAPERPWDGGPFLLPLSAANAAALAARAAEHAGALARDAAALPALCRAAAVGPHGPYRAALVAGDAEEMRGHLEALAGAEQPVEEPAAAPPRIGMLFTGQGAQYAGMGRGLYDRCPPFREMLDRCAAILDASGALPRPLLSVIFGEGEAAELLNETAFTQPALFTIEVALYELWRSWGIEPAVVIGHSVGEYAAIYAAGVLSLEDALKLIAERGRLMQTLPPGGAMAAVFAAEEPVAAALAGRADRVSIAAINGPKSVVISGEGTAVAEVVDELKRERIRSQRLVVSHAFHSPLMDPILDDFEAVAARLCFRTPRIGLIANVTGDLADEAICSAAYWRRHVREPVRFAAGMEALQRQGVDTYLEAGPHPVLLGMGRRCVSAGDSLWLPSLKRDRDAWPQVLESLGALYVRGAAVSWPALLGHLA